MTLQEQLQTYKNDPSHQLPLVAQDLLDGHIKALKAKSDDYGLIPGAKAPDFTFDASTSGGHLYKHLEDGPVVLTFIRGNWCTYCNLQLKAYEAMMPEITAAGAKLFIVTMQAEDKDHEHLTLIKDKDGVIAKLYKVLYPIEKGLAHVYKDLHVNLSLENSDGQWHLPLTATYIIDQKALIRHTFIDADYKNRMEPESILAILNIIS